MELYLNQIYLGNNSYGILSGALNYFDKELSELTLEEASMLAALPKSPSYINPIHNINRAKERRDWVLERMYQEDFITSEEYKRAINTPVQLKKRRQSFITDAEYYSETVRKELMEKFGEDAVYKNGLTVFSNINPKLQKTASKSLRNGLLAYDKKYGYRGAIDHISIEDWQQQLKQVHTPKDIESFQKAVVLKVNQKQLEIGLFENNEAKTAVVDLQKSQWVRKKINQGDVILVSSNSGEYFIEQIPEVNGAIVVLETKTGRVLAETGGYSFKKSNFDRVTQANRQPGSTFKPFLYMAALENGFEPNSILLDEPISLSQGAGMPMWTPKNFANDFLGPITLRSSLEKSRNLSTVYLLDKIGVDPVIEMATRLGVYKNSPPKILSIALGAYETKVIDLANAFNMIASGGIKVEPKFIDRVYNRAGEVIYSSDATQITNETDLLPKLSNNVERLVDESINYQIISILKGVVNNGTAWKAKSLGKIIAGKTGTTNNAFDAWFVGFTKDIVVAVYVGFDNPKTLGKKEAGAVTALPIFIEFMKEALVGYDDVDFDVPENIQFVKIDKQSGSPSNEGGGLIDEAFTKEKARKIDEELIEALEKSSENSMEGIY